MDARKWSLLLTMALPSVFLEAKRKILGPLTLLDCLAWKFCRMWPVPSNRLKLALAVLGGLVVAGQVTEKSLVEYFI